MTGTLASKILLVSLAILISSSLYPESRLMAELWLNRFQMYCRLKNACVSGRPSTQSLRKRERGVGGDKGRGGEERERGREKGRERQIDTQTDR